MCSAGKGGALAAICNWYESQKFKNMLFLETKMEDNQLRITEADSNTTAVVIDTNQLKRKIPSWQIINF